MPIMPVLTRSATIGTSEGAENDYEMQELRATGRDTPDARLMLTVDSAGRQYTASSPVPIHSCVNIAMQTNDDEADSCWSIVGCMKKALIQRLAMIVGGILVVIAIILLERFLGADIFDEKKLIQDITAELLPQLVRNATAGAVKSNQ
jgi:hypothetical protein